MSAQLPSPLSNIKAIWRFHTPVTWLRDLLQNLTIIWVIAIQFTRLRVVQLYARVRPTHHRQIKSPRNNTSTEFILLIKPNILIILQNVRSKWKPFFTLVSLFQCIPENRCIYYWQIYKWFVNASEYDWYKQTCELIQTHTICNWNNSIMTLVVDILHHGNLGPVYITYSVSFLLLISLYKNPRHQQPW